MKIKGYTWGESFRVWCAGLFIRGKLWHKMASDEDFLNYLLNTKEKRKDSV